MGTILGTVVGIDTDNLNNKVYRVLLSDISKKGNDEYNWKFRCNLVPEEKLRGLPVNKWLNIKFENNKITGLGAALSRFNSTNHHPYVVLSKLVSDDDRILGYKIASYDGAVKNIPLKSILAYGNRIAKMGAVPIQNAIFIPADGDKREYFKSYPDCDFIKEVIHINKNTKAEQKRVQLQKNGKTLNNTSKLEEIYTKDQLVQLKLGKDKGVDIRIYANPALTAHQMKQLRKGLEMGLNVKPIAFPEYKVDAMAYYIDTLEAGFDIRTFTNPKYDIGQIAELALAYELGLDISKMSNPKYAANEMAEIRERLERNIWKDELVNKDGDWK